tara:strand:- start:107 stop:343 length:237 start_codon:yes stop_codon:yes gene_type:complete
MIGGNRMYFATHRRLMFHVIMIASFTAAMYLLPMVQEMVKKYIDNTIGQTLVPYIVLYIGALYILPEIGFSIMRSISE